MTKKCYQIDKNMIAKKRYSRYNVREGRFCTNRKEKDMGIKQITDPDYRAYGRVLTGEIKVDALIEALNKKDAPADDVVYVPSVAEFESLSEAKEVQASFFGGVPMQIGYCNGTNNKLNAVEYHRSSEFGIASTDLILLLGKQQDISDDFTYETKNIEAFFVPAGTVYEMYATTLHYAPCSVDGKPFRNIVILPKETNWDVDFTMLGAKEDKLLTAKNKWLIAHKDANIEGAFNGLIGENTTI